MFSYKHMLAMAAAAMTALTPAAFAGDMAPQLGYFHGKVLINQGQFFEPIFAGVNLKTGDRILVGDKSAATLTFGNCQLSLAPASLFTVSAQAICPKGETVALVNGVIVTPVAAGAPSGQLNQLIANYSKRQKFASQKGDAATADCLGGQITKMKALRNFWSRNPGVDPVPMINDLDQAAASCGQAQPMQKAQVVETPTPEPIVLSPPAPIVTSSTGGFSGGTLALVGAAGLGAVGLGALLLLNKDSSSTTVSVPPG
jgi:hypothetical protein